MYKMENLYLSAVHCNRDECLLCLGITFVSLFHLLNIYSNKGFYEPRNKAHKKDIKTRVFCIKN